MNKLEYFKNLLIVYIPQTCSLSCVKLYSLLRTHPIFHIPFRVNVPSFTDSSTPIIYWLWYFCFTAFTELCHSRSMWKSSLVGSRKLPSICGLSLEIFESLRWCGSGMNSSKDFSLQKPCLIYNIM